MKPDSFLYVSALLPAACRPRRLAVSLVTLHMLWATAAWSQRSWAMFGPSADRGLGFSPRGLALASSSRRGAEIAVLEGGRPRVLFFAVDSAGSLVPTDSCALGRPQSAITAADLDGSGTESFVTLAAAAPEITVIERQGGGHRLRTLQAEAAQRLVIADIDNDRRPDILLFGRSTAGVATLLNRGSGVFVRGPRLFPDISVSDLAVADLNGDGINDVFLLNWISNQLVIFYGITRMIFSEQLTVETPGEPSELALSSVTTRRTVRVAVTIPSERRLAVFDGNSLGDFSLTARMETPAPPSGIRMVDINRDGAPDLVSSTARGMLVVPAAGKASFGAPQLYGVTSVEGSWTAGDADGDGQPDLIAADRTSGRLHVIAGASGTGTLSRSSSTAVGSGPRGVVLADLDGDGLEDITVANSLSGTVSFLLNQGNGKFSSQLCVPVPDQPWQVSSFASGRQHGIVVTHPGAGRITVIQGGDDMAHAVPFSMPTAEQPAVVEALADPEGGRLRIVVRCRRAHEAGVGLSSFEQLSGRQFLERTIRPTVGAPVLAAIGALTQAGNGYDLLFAAGTRASREATVYSATASSGLEFGAVTPVLTYRDSTQSTSFLIWGSSRNDGSREAAVVLGEPRNAVGVFRVAPGTTSRVTTWLNGIHIRDWGATVLRDADGDGIDDLLVLDGERSALVLYRGRSGGRFRTPQNIVEGPDIGGFDIGPLFRPGVNDLVLTRPSAGCVTVMPDPFGRPVP